MKPQQSRHGGNVGRAGREETEKIEDSEGTESGRIFKASGEISRKTSRGVINHVGQGERCVLELFQRL